MNKRALIWFAGLDTPIASDLCGMRPLLEKLSAQICADLVVASWDGAGMYYPVAETLRRICNADDEGHTYDFLAAGGHSHGADELYKLLAAMANNGPLFDVASFFDLAPYGDPTAWQRGPLAAPTNVLRTQCFFQRNDVPLAGCRMIGGSPSGQAVELFDVTPWGLHHASMLADPRVQNRFELAVLRAVNEQNRASSAVGITTENTETKEHA